MISRIDVRSSGADPFGESIRQQIRELGHDVGEIRTARIFLIDLPNSARRRTCGGSHASCSPTRLSKMRRSSRTFPIAPIIRASKSTSSPA